jgi:hypothetical protein
VGATEIRATVGGQVGTAQVAVSAPAAPPRVETPPPVVENPRQAITELVQAYAQALQAKDLARVRALYPTMTRGTERSTQDALTSMDDLRVRLAPTRIDVSGSTAEATVTGEWVYRGGRLDVTNRYELERRAGGWVIVHIE